MQRLTSLLLAALILSSCSHAFNENLRKSAELDIPFTSTQSNIDRDTGAVFIWGGIIANSVSSDSGNFMEIVKTPLDKYGKVIDPQYSEGRFLVYSPSSLITHEYHAGRLISVAGFLIKGIEAEMDGKPYTYPLIEAIDIRLWGDMKGEIPKAYFQSDTEDVFPWTDPER